MSENKPFSAEFYALDHVDEREKKLLKCVLDFPDRWDVIEFLEVDDFYYQSHRYFWQAIKNLHKMGNGIGEMLVRDQLRIIQTDLDDREIRELLFLIKVEDVWYSHVEAYAKVISKAAHHRRLASVGQKIIELASQTDDDFDSLLAEGKVALERVSDRATEDGLIPVQHLLEADAIRMDALQDSDYEFVGLPTGFFEIDNLLGGLGKSDLIILAARPSMGKTSLQCGIALNVAASNVFEAEDRKPVVAMFSAEMSKEQILHRLIANETGISVNKIQRGRFTPDEQEKYNKANAKIEQMSLFIDDTDAITPDKMVSRLRRIEQTYGLDIVFIDHLGKLGFDKHLSEYQAVSRNVAAVKDIAKRFSVPVVLATQLSRGVEQRKDKRPILSDLRDSGRIEEEADVVMLLYRDEYYNENTTVPNQAEVIIAKHRNGAIGTRELYFQREATKFVNLHKEHIDLSEYSW